MGALIFLSRLLNFTFLCSKTLCTGIAVNAAFQGSEGRCSFKPLSAQELRLLVERRGSRGLQQPRCSAISRAVKGQAEKQAMGAELGAKWWHFRAELCGTGLGGGSCLWEVWRLAAGVGRTGSCTGSESLKKGLCGVRNWTLACEPSGGGVSFFLISSCEWQNERWGDCRITAFVVQLDFLCPSWTSLPMTDYACV